MPRTPSVVHPNVRVMTTKKQTAKAVIYARISNDPKKAADGQPDADGERRTQRGGDGLGVERQEQDCREIAEQNGWPVTEVFADNDLSAFSGKRRPRFEALLDAMKNGEVDALLCWHTDRLYRSMKDLERLIEIADVAGVSIRTVQGGDLDLSTSAGRMIARILGSVARQESEHMSERRVRANQQKAEQGKWQTANRAFGYTLDGQPREPEASEFRQAVVDVLAGKSIQGIAKSWNERGIKTTLADRERRNPHTGATFKVSGQWAAPSVRRLLVNPRYAGLKMHRGKEVGKGDWTALIDEDTHRGLVAYLSDPSRIKCTSFERKYLGTNLYRCGHDECEGGLMKAAMPGGTTKTGRANRQSRAYVCRKTAHVLRTGQPVDDYVVATVLERLSRPDAHLLLETPVDLTGLQTKRTALVAKLDDFAAMFAKDEIDGAQLRRGTADVRAKLAKLDTQLADATRTSPVAALLASGERLWERWEAMSVTQRAQAIDEIAVVTILPCPKGLRRFSSDFVTVKWRRDDA
jgi:site-specific DNA recombinase